MSNNNSRIENFSVELETECYCGKHITIKYDESTGEKSTICKHCGYNHNDFIYTLRKHEELSTATFLNQFFK